MELIRLEYQSFRDFAETAWPNLGRDGLWTPPGAPLPEGLGEVRLEVGLAEGSPLLRGIVRVEPEAETGRAFLRFIELDRPSRVLLDRIEAKLGRPVAVGPALEQAPPGEEAGPEPADERPVPPTQPEPPTPEETRPSTVAEGIPSRPMRPRGGEQGRPASPIEAHTLEELADLLAGQDRQQALAQTQRISASPPRPAGGEEAPEPPADAAPPPSGPSEPAPLPPYLGGPDPEAGPRRIVVRSPWLWLALVVGLLLGAWALGRGLRGDGPEEAPSASSAPAPSGPPAVEQDSASSSTGGVGGTGDSRAIPVGPPFDSVEGIEWEVVDSSTVVTVRVNGAIARERWSTQRVEAESPRQVLTLVGVTSFPSAGTLEIGGERLARVRTGLHRGPGGEDLHVVVDLADAAVRLTGVDVRERALRLIFVRG